MKFSIIFEMQFKILVFITLLLLQVYIQCERIHIVQNGAHSTFLKGQGLNFYSSPSSQNITNIYETSNEARLLQTKAISPPANLIDAIKYFQLK
jgi:hypothetical protein